MAITPTGAIFKTLTFDGRSSSEFGVHITGESVFNAAERDVEFIDIPGRNGAYALDKGRFNNMQVTYPAGMYADTEADFAQGISDFRNWLCSRKGYARLTDDYNPGEYRLAIYKSGLEVDPAQLLAGEFTITFDCKPERFLTSGETAEAVTSGGTITNPTLFESKPIIEVIGYGSIDINGETITVDDVPIGNINLAGETTVGLKNPPDSSSVPIEFGSVQFDVSNLNNGDSITLGKSELIFTVTAPREQTYNASASYYSGESWNVSATIATNTSINFTISIPALSFSKGSATSKSYTYHYSAQFNNGNVSQSGRDTVRIDYDGADTISISSTTTNDTPTFKNLYVGTLGAVSGNSTKSITDTKYINLDIGEAYIVSNGEYVSINNAVTLPAELPTLAPGANVITYDNTFTDFEIVPNWWIV